MPSAPSPRTLLLAALFACSALAGCQKNAQSRGGRTLALAHCRLKGFGSEALCGSLQVFEDRAARKGRTIDLKVSVLPALSADPLPDPIFLLAGGPGQAATEAFAPLLRALAPLRRTRDLVFVDQRGTGASRKLDCALVAKDAALKERFEQKFDQEKIAACARTLDADPRFYTTPLAMDDLDDVRQALGHARINLWGGSYGTRAALVYARQHPDRVRSLVLDGVAPLTLLLPLYFARDAERSLRLTLAQCEADKACAARFPGLQQRFEELLARLAVHPERVRVDDPLTGAPLELEITQRRLVENLRGLLYSAELTALLPLTLERAAGGDFRSFVAEANQLTAVQDGIALGMFLSVVCSEDVPFVAEEKIDELAGKSFIGAWSARELLQSCASWPRGSVPRGYRDAVRSEAPALLLSGELDPVTPPSWADEALRTLPNGVHLVAAGVGHGVTAVGCVPDLVQRFLDKGSAKELDASCLRTVQRPPFFLGFAGPAP